MSVDDTEQPEIQAHPDDSIGRQTEEQAAPDTAAPDTAAPDTAAPDTAAPDTAAPDTPTDAGEMFHTPPTAPTSNAPTLKLHPHVTPPLDVTPPQQPTEADQLPSDTLPSTTPTLVHMGASQVTSAQPPTPAVSPATFNVPTQPPMPEAIAAQPPARQQRGRGCGVLAIFSAICIVALLASGSYVLFNLLSSHTEGDVARIIPSSTVALVSIDLVAAATHGQRATTGDLGNVSGQGDTFKLLTGLDWTKDVLPWVGRDIAFSAFQRQPPYRSPNGGQGISAATVNDTIGGAFLLQSRDDGAARAAIRKAAKYQQSHGLTLATLDYHGLTLYHLSLLQGDESGTTLAAGKGWAIVAGDLPAARAIVDRLTGNSAASDTLAETSAYRDALGTLPANRFGTLFLNVRALVKTFVYSSSAQTQMVSTLANTYPAAVGSLAWTSGGLRAQLTFPSARNIAVGSLAGDTTTLANLTPADAFAYSGVANLGALLRAQKALTAQGNPATDTSASFFGLVPTDPALQQPAALSLIGEPKGTTGYLVLLNAPDRADALAVVQQAAEQQHWTPQSTKVGGTIVTAYYAKLPLAQNATDAATNIDPASVTAIPGARLVGMDTWMDNTLIFASNATAMTDAIHTIRDHAPDLAHDTRFQQLVHAAPGGGCATTFLDLSRSATAGDAATSVLLAGLGQSIQAIAITQAWNDNHYQATADLLLSK